MQTSTILNFTCKTPCQLGQYQSKASEVVSAYAAASKEMKRLFIMLPLHVTRDQCGRWNLADLTHAA